ncbi:alpha/beta hydrolase [Prescottella equi]|uniref:alpha/beta fold hydrolase n=1 Tax=Rhodococcus hoagii TaxID=43767 RepID=UPI001C73E4E7|nr:alpha/beta hydrolase [Prescottella equi]BCN63087.1 alpha/beta hydrolase [Prescottella equi]BCN72940.1 alpha/beta hydrolase [Prescottella equi]BCN77938.1 alpha/beta hydrolase [Prescottella equi]
MLSETPDPPHVLAVGAGDRTVVLVHGYSDHGGTWQKVIPTLAERYRVLAVDLPGFGRSSGYWREPLIDGYVEALADLVADEPEPVSVIGNSLGSVTALAFASQRPDLVANVVLSDMPGVTGIPRTWTRGTQLRLDRITRLLTAPLPDRYLQQMMGAVYAGLALRHPLRADATVRAGYSEHYATRQQVSNLLAIGTVVIREIADLPIPRMLDELTVPALLLWGENDLLTPAKAARRVTVTPDRAVAVIPSCGHCPQLDCPSEFLAEVLPFLAR